MKYFRKYFLCILCWSLCTTLAGQSFRKIDSLERVLVSGKLKNQEKADLLLDLSFAYLYVDTAKCRTLAIEALELAQTLGKKSVETKARAYFALGNFFAVNNLLYQAHAHFIKAEKIFLELDNKEMLNRIYTNLMIMFFNIDDLDNAAYYANKVLTLTTENKEWKYIIYAQMTLGEARYRNNKNQEALDYFLKLHQKALRTEDSLGVIHNISSHVGQSCADIYIRMKRYQDALPYFHQLITYLHAQGNKMNTGAAYNKLAYVHSMMHNVDSTEYYISKMLNSGQLINYIYPAYRAAAKIDSIKGNYQSALANIQKYHHIKDSISKEEKTTEMARLKVWHEFDQKELEKTLIEQEFQKQRKLILILAISLVMILLLLAIAVYFYQKITEKNLEITEKNLEMRDLHTVKDKLFSVVAHDLRSPVSALVSMLKLADANQLNAEEQAQLFKDISNRVDNTHNLIDNLLSWAKSQMKGIVPSPVYFDVQEESRLVTDSLRAMAAGKHITLENRIEPQWVYTDRDMFTVVVRNLTTNSIKYTSAGGEVILSSELSDNLLVVSVRDTGIGMPLEIQEKLFKLLETKSQRGTDNESGTGLGLVLCADFIKANGGNIWFNSAEGEGATFFFSVPVKTMQSDTHSQKCRKK